MRNIFLILLITLSVITKSVGQANASVLAYIEQYKNIAMEEMLRTGVPASITLAQGLLESQAGKSELAIASNNHFGIKCKSNWTGDVYYYDDDAKQECFRSYTSPEESFKDHSNFLRTRPNYGFLFKLPVDNYEAWAKGLKKAGYATNPVYAQRIIKYIHDYNLQQYTLLAFRMQQITDSSVVDNSIPGQAEIIAATGSSEELPDASSKLSGNDNISPGDKNQYPEGVFAINQKRVIYLQKGVSLFAIATKYGITYKKLLEFNELDDIDILYTPSLIYLEKKLKRGENEYHVMATNETIEAIAQTEGVQLASLLEYNHLIKGSQPSVGAKIYLQSERNGLVQKSASRSR